MESQSAHCVCYSLTRRSTPLPRLVRWKVCVLLCTCCLLVQGSETEPGTAEPGELDCVSLGGYLALWKTDIPLSRCQNFSRSITLHYEKSQFPRARLGWSFLADELRRITFHSLAWNKKSHVKSVTHYYKRFCTEIRKYHLLWRTQTGKWKWLGECERWTQSRQIAAQNVNFGANKYFQ